MTELLAELVRRSGTHTQNDWTKGKTYKPIKYRDDKGKNTFISHRWHIFRPLFLRRLSGIVCVCVSYESTSFPGIYRLLRIFFCSTYFICFKLPNAFRVFFYIVPAPFAISCQALHNVVVSKWLFSDGGCKHFSHPVSVHRPRIHTRPNIKTRNRFPQYI